MSNRKSNTTKMAIKQYKLKDSFAKKDLKTPVSLLKSKFAIDEDTIIQAIQGDVTAAKYLGEMGRQGRLTSELMPKITENIIAAIKGTEDYNVLKSKIYNQTLKSGLAIDKAVDSVEIESLKYRNGQIERKEILSNSRKTENQRHKWVLEYLAAKYNIDFHMANVDHNDKILNNDNRPEVKQIAEDMRYQAQLINHYLDSGEKGNPELITKKDYVTVDVPSQSMPNQPTNIFGRAIGTLRNALGV